jgi:hypothetical protein
MRIWTLHPRYLDPQGLVALWREALLARAVLRGETRGYRHHPQLLRFQSHATPRSAINAYLAGILEEARMRNYAFDRRKAGPLRTCAPIPATQGQLAYEWRHLLQKLARRSPAQHARWNASGPPLAHPLFRIVPGEAEAWERQPP